MTDRFTRRILALLLDRDDVFDTVAAAIADARDAKPRAPGDADSGDVLDHVIRVLRGNTKP